MPQDARPLWTVIPRNEAVDQKLYDLRAMKVSAEEVRQWGTDAGLTGKLSPLSEEQWPIAFAVLWIALRDEIAAENMWLYTLAAGALPLEKEEKGKPLYFKLKEHCGQL